MTLKKRYGYLWVTLGFFLFSLAGQWICSWFVYVNHQEEHRMPVQFKEYVLETSKDMLENWQSEFLQLIWQVAGLSFLLYIGSPQSKESDERKEEKLDLLLKKLDPENAEKLIQSLDKKYPRE